jgi:hypothetical protein
VGFFGKKLSFGALKDAVADAATQVSEKVKSVDVAGTIASAKETIVEAGERTLEATHAAYEVTKEKAAVAYESAAEEVRNFDYTQLKSAEFYQESFKHYKDLSQDKVSEYFRSTFEVDKSTMQMVDDVLNRLPVPATTVDDIFAQCKKEAIRRAVASFGLGTLVHDIDQHSADKYDNLSESYKEFKDRSPGLSLHENYGEMQAIREAAEIRGACLGTWKMATTRPNHSLPAMPTLSTSLPRRNISTTS